jgi:hypothetical protein
VVESVVYGRDVPTSGSGGDNRPARAALTHQKSRRETISAETIMRAAADAQVFLATKRRNSGNAMATLY